MEIEVSRRVAAPAERVWRLTTDLAAAPTVLSGVDAVEVLAGGEPFDVGTRWRETRTMFGRSATEEMEVTDIDVGRRYTVVAESRGTRYETVVAVEPDGSGSRISMRFGAQPAGVGGKVLAATVGRLFAGSTRKMLRRDLDDIAAAAEAVSGG